MGKFYIYDSNNILHSEGSCPDGDENLQSYDGLLVGLGEVPKSITYPPEPTKPVDYLRKQDYPPVGDQLDMLWHAMDNGTLTKVPEFYNAIKEVKNRHPK